MRNFFEIIKKSILLFIMAILFCLTWPFIILFGWVKSIFSNKISDSEKVSMTKEIISGCALLIILGIIYYFFG